MQSVEKELSVAYEIQMTDLPPLTIYHSANAWWLNRAQVIKLIQGFLKGFNVQQSCLLAGISDMQYRYFLKRHPEFYYIKEACEDALLIQAKNTIAANIHDPKIARWYLERKQRDEFGR